MASGDDDGVSGGWRVGFALVSAVLILVLTVSLGIWQLRRAEEKLTLQSQWDAALRSAPLDAAAEFSSIAGRLPVRVQLTGRWLYAYEVWLDNRMQGGRTGLRWLVPLQLPDGAVVLIDRGFAVRNTHDRRQLPKVSRSEAAASVVGVAVARPERTLELGSDPAPTDPRPWVWQNLERSTFERASGLRVAGWFVLQQDGVDDGLDRRPPVLQAGVDRHRGYAFQWFALAALIACLTVWFALQAALKARAAGNGG